MAVADLHLHPVMDAGMPLLFRGRPSESPAPCVRESGMLTNQVSFADLRAADVRLTAATLYASPVFSQLRGGYGRELLRQLRIVKAWASASGLAVVRTPEEAEDLCRAKDHRLGVVLAVEGTHGVVTEKALETLYAEGVRLLTITHLVDSPWAGAARIRYWPFPEGGPGVTVEKRSALGLTDLGRRLLKRAVQLGMVIDLSHAGDLTIRDVAELLPNLPAVFTHQSVRELSPNERSVSGEALRLVGRTGGIAGVTFNAQFIGPGIQDVVSHAQVIVREAGPEALALGSDFNGFVRRVRGVANSAGYAAVLDALEAAGLKGVRTSAEAFAAVWRRSLKAAAV